MAAFGKRLEISVVENDEWCFPAKLQVDPLQGVGSRLHHFLSRVPDEPVIEIIRRSGCSTNACPVVVPTRHDVKHAGRKTPPLRPTLRA